MIYYALLNKKKITLRIKRKKLSAYQYARLTKKGLAIRMVDRRIVGIQLHKLFRLIGPIGEVGLKLGSQINLHWFIEDIRVIDEKNRIYRLDPIAVKDKHGYYITYAMGHAGDLPSPESLQKKGSV